ncbi:MAG: endonuclease/exonuclease/phosphatase family protein, partial [Phycisphaerae bacterium]|nr:endonuclease/exonuclease/phosphatase family protein [Phycisphaerae bacterium]
VTLPPILGRFDPDIMLFAMALSPAQTQTVMSQVSPQYTQHSFGFFHVLSRVPLRHAQSFSLRLARDLPAGLDRGDPRQIAPPPDETRHTFEYVYNVAARQLGLPPRFFRNTDPGSILVLRFDGPNRLARELVVWYIDLPSDPFLAKAVLAEQVVRRMAEIVRDTGTEPDFIVGDFNIPRDSASLVRIAGQRRSAFDDAGWGFFSTWPRARPALHIDHMFMSGAWRCVAYQREDPGRSDHCVQSAVFQAR